MKTQFVTITVTKGGMQSQKESCKNTDSRSMRNRCRLICFLAVFVLGLLFFEPVTVNPDDDDFVGVSATEYVYENDVRSYDYSISKIAATATTTEAIEIDLAEPVLPDPENTIQILESLAIPTGEKSNTGAKTYMSYKAITCPSSPQYVMQQDAWTDDNGFRRYGDYFMVALGTFYAKAPGETFLITLDSGVSFMAITGDIKDDKHTDSLHQHRNGNIVEFIVDTKEIPRMCRLMGDMSYANDFSGRIAAIERITDSAAV